MENTYRVRIKIGDFEFEAESSERAFVEEKLKEHLASKGNALTESEKPDPQKTVIESAVAAGKKLSLTEFVRKVNPKSGTQKVVAVAYYKEKLDGKADVPAIEVTAGLKAIKYNHSNYRMAISEAKRIGYLMDGNLPKTVVVSSTGEDWVEKQLRGGNEISN